MTDQQVVRYLASKLDCLGIFDELLPKLSKLSQLLPAITKLYDKHKAYLSPTQDENLALWVETAIYNFIKLQYTKGLDWIINNDFPFHPVNLQSRSYDKINLYYQATLHPSWSYGLEWLLHHSQASQDDMEHTLNFIGEHNHLHLLEPLHANIKDPFKVIKASYEACIRVGSFQLFNYASTQKFHLTAQTYCVINTLRLLHTEIVQCQRFLDDYTNHLNFLQELQRLNQQYQADIISLLSHKRGMSTPLILYVLSWL